MANALVQSATTSFGSSASSRSLAFPGNVTAGNLLVVCLDFYANGGAAPTLTVTDSLGQTYTATPNSPMFWVNQGCAIYYFPNTAGGACTVTIATSVAIYQTITVLEYSGIATASPLRADAAGTHSSSSTPTTNSISASAGDLVVITYGQGDSAITSCSANSPFTQRSSQLNGSSFDAGAVADDLNASGAEAGSFTISAARNWTALGAAFKAGVSSVTTSWSDTVTFGPATGQAPDSANADTLTFTDLIFPASVNLSFTDTLSLGDGDVPLGPGTLQATDTLTFTDTQTPDNIWSDTLTLSDSGGNVVVDNFTGWSDGILFSGRLRCNTGVLVSGTYRR